jgi:hypothetical protein
MLQAILKISLALSTFLIGTSIFLLQTSSFKSLEQSEIESLNEFVEQSSLPVTTCNLSNEPDLYNAKRISVEATAWRVGDRVMLSGNCNFADIFVFITINVEDLKTLNPEIANSLKDIKTEKGKQVDVRIIGIAKRELSEYKDWIRVRIVPNKIEQLSPIEDFVPRGSA